MTEEKTNAAPSTRLQQPKPITIAGANHPHVSAPAAGLRVGHSQNTYRAAFASYGSTRHVRGVSDKNSCVAVSLDSTRALPPGTAEETNALEDKIRTLWTSEGEKRSSAKRTRTELAEIRKELSQSLYAYKAVLVSRGRAGKWQKFLREVNIPLSTADRLVGRFERSVNPSENVLSEELSPPTPEQIKKIVAKYQAKLSRVLTTEESVEQFMIALGAALQGPPREA